MGIHDLSENYIPEKVQKVLKHLRHVMTNITYRHSMREILQLWGDSVGQLSILWLPSGLRCTPINYVCNTTFVMSWQQRSWQTWADMADWPWLLKTLAHKHLFSCTRLLVPFACTRLYLVCVPAQVNRTYTYMYTFTQEQGRQVLGHLRGRLAAQHLLLLGQAPAHNNIYIHICIYI